MLTIIKQFHGVQIAEIASEGKLSRAIPILAYFFLLLFYHLIFRDFFFGVNGLIGHDYSLTLTSLLDGYLWYLNNGFISAPWFTPSFCGGQAFYADPISTFYSIPQFLSFVLSPLDAVYITLLLFASIGYWGFFLYSKYCCNINTWAAISCSAIFMFNNFFSHRMIVGHVGFHGFMLVPLIAYLLLVKQKSVNILFLYSVLVGLLITYWPHSGMGGLVIPAALSVIWLCLFSSLYEPEKIKSFVLRGLIATIVAVGLCFSKLNAAYELMKNFPRDYYPIPGISGIFDILSVIFMSLVDIDGNFSIETEGLWKGMVYELPIHELSYSLSFVWVEVAIIGLIIIIKYKSIDYKRLFRLSWLYWVSLMVLIILCLMPIAIMYYEPGWNSILKRIPVINTTTSPYRWMIIYIPVVSILIGVVVSNSVRYSLILTFLLIVGLLLENGFAARSYYFMQSIYYSKPVIDYYNKIKEGSIRPIIKEIVGPVGFPKIGPNYYANNSIVQGASSLQCYNPLYGYRNEKFNVDPLQLGGVFKPVGNGQLNFRNPACMVFSSENDCELWGAFKIEQQAELEKFISYRHYDFVKSKRQIYADYITMFFLGLCSIIIFVLCVRYLKSGMSSSRH